jgi:hypothetical protein
MYATPWHGSSCDQFVMPLRRHHREQRRDCLRQHWTGRRSASVRLYLPGDYSRCTGCYPIFEPLFPNDAFVSLRIVIRKSNENLSTETVNSTFVHVENTSKWKVNEDLPKFKCSSAYSSEFHRCSWSWAMTVISGLLQYELNPSNWLVFIFWSLISLRRRCWWYFSQTKYRKKVCILCSTLVIIALIITVIIVVNETHKKWGTGGALLKIPNRDWTAGLAVW